MRRYSLSILIDREFICKAKWYFERKVKFDTGRTYFSDCNEWLWDEAYTILIAGQQGVIIPLKNGRAINLGSQPLTEKQILVTVNDSLGFQSELIQVVPDNPDSIGRFTGFLMPACSAQRFGKHFASKVSSHRLQYGSAAVLNEVGQPPGYGVDGEEPPVKDEKSFTLIGGHNVIGNIKDYCKCFDNNPGSDHTYEVMLCVSQPIPNTRDPWGLSKKHHSETGNPVCVGHVFLVMKEKAPHKTVVRNMGFYPSGFVWPYKPQEQGELVNDSYHDYNVSLAISVNSSQFTAILNFIYQGNDKGFMYNLNSNNCTTFALNALGVANIKIPRTIGYWKKGSGLNPGDLGEDIRVMQLSNNMKRNTVYTAHGNQGECI